jgi:hypothetical protein
MVQSAYLMCKGGETHRVVLTVRDVSSGDVTDSSAAELAAAVRPLLPPTGQGPPNINKVTPLAAEAVEEVDVQLQ